jgi:hypothetical protein
MSRNNSDQGEENIGHVSQPPVSAPLPPPGVPGNKKAKGRLRARRFIHSSITRQKLTQAVTIVFATLRYDGQNCAMPLGRST